MEIDEQTLVFAPAQDRKSTRLNSSHLGISYAVFCLKKKKKQTIPVANPPIGDAPIASESRRKPEVERWSSSKIPDKPANVHRQYDWSYDAQHQGHSHS